MSSRSRPPACGVRRAEAHISLTLMRKQSTSFRTISPHTVALACAMQRLRIVAQVEFVSAGDSKAALHADFPAELADWLLDEMRDNRRPRRAAARRRFWEGTDAEVRIVFESACTIQSNHRVSSI
jgi:hypothetical protein